MRSSGTSRRSGTPPTVAALTTGTIWSPWPPSTSAVTSFTDEPVSHAMKVAKRDVSRIPAMPITRSRGQPETLFATWHIASSGFETTISTASGDAAATFAVTSATIFSFVRHEVVAAHARAARHAGRDHDDARARRVSS